MVGNQHGLLQYLMLSSMEEIGHTFFFWSRLGISDSVMDKVGVMKAPIPELHPTGIAIFDNLKKAIKFLYTYRVYFPVRFPFILNSKLEFWGHDHVYKSYCIFRNHHFCLLEDGTLNYYPYPYPQPKRFLWFKRIFAGLNYGEHLSYAGSEKRCSRIYLTGLLDHGDVLKDPKVKIASFVDMWNSSDKDKRDFINNVFGITPALIEKCLGCKQILLTQPFSETELITEDEKIEMYKQILSKIGHNDIIIKPHPREKTNYSKYFPNYVILNTKAPMQLLTLNGIKFESAYSINSTALFDFPYRLKVCVLGSEIYPKLYEKRPDWSSDNFKVTNKNVELFKLSGITKIT